MDSKDILILGLGNLLLSDEGVGPQIIRQLEKIRLPENVELLDGGTSGFDLLPQFQGRRKILILDAIMAEGPPGSIFRLLPENLQFRQPAFISAHQSALYELMRFAQIQAPSSEVIIFGIVPRETGQYAIELSPEVKRSIPKIISLILDELANIPSSRKS